MEEPVASLIIEAIQDNDTGSVNGVLSEQVSVIRAAFAVYQYNTDRSILQRIALWCRYLEIEFDQLTEQDHSVLYQPADLMETLVTFYQVTGLKGVLRLCARLRAAAFNWTTALHTFQQSIPIQKDSVYPEMPVLTEVPAAIDFSEKEKLINHGEMLADGIRYALYSGIYSGNGQDLAAGKTVWRYLKKHHFALCGGTTANPYLCGCAADQPVSNRCLAAWTETFSSLLLLPDTEWAADELIRIVYNGLDDCLNRPEVYEFQYVNSYNDTSDSSPDPVLLYTRLTRAAADTFMRMFTLTEKGIRVNYLLSGKLLVMVKKQPVILTITDDSILFHNKKPVSCDVEVYMSSGKPSQITLICGRKEKSLPINQCVTDTGLYFHIAKKDWQDTDCIHFETEQRIICENTHHQGLCFVSDNRLFSLPVSTENHWFAVSCDPEMNNGKMTVDIYGTSAWKSGEDKADIPVLPEGISGPVRSELKPYGNTFRRITMFPRIKGE